MGYEQKFVIVPIDELTVIEIQRKPSAQHVRRLAESMRKIGFTTPVIAVERGGRCVVIDGQHRLLAAKQVGISEIPCIIIPEEYAYDLMELNVEKQMSLREKAHVALNVYRMYLEEDASTPENDPRILDSIESPHYITLGVAYEKNERLYGSAFESILRRVDRFLDLPLSEAMGERERRAELVLGADELVREAVDRVKELGMTHPFLYKEVVSFCNPIGRKRKLDVTFEEVFEQLQENLRRLISQPEQMKMHKFSEAFEG
ncbi:MAG: ParB/RepB/Spo0J family partition protein [Candidatus Alkanophagales archaeon]